MSNVNMWAEVVCWSNSVSVISEFNRKKMEQFKKGYFQFDTFPMLHFLTKLML